MKKYIIIFSSLIIIISSLQGCKKCGEPGEDPCPCPACPIVTALVPDHGIGGEEIQLIGSNLGDFVLSEDQVTINGKSALVTSVENDKLSVQVPDQAGTGPVIVTIGSLRSDDEAVGGNAPTFTYDVVALTAIEPTFARHGEQVKLTGSFFSSDPSENTVTINGVLATVENATATELTVIVPKGAGSGEVAVEVDGNIASGPQFFYEYTATVSTFAGSGANEYTDGQGNSAAFRSPNTLVVSPAGDIMVGDLDKVRQISPQGEVSTVALMYTSIILGIGSFRGIHVDAAGIIYLSDRRTHRIIRFPQGLAGLSYAGDVFGSSGYQDGQRFEAKFNFPGGIIEDNDGNIVIADHFNNCIRRLGIDDTVSTIAGINLPGDINANGTNARFNQPRDVAYDLEGNLLVVDGGNHKIKKITPNGAVTTFAGSVQGYRDDVGESARFNSPAGIAVDKDGNMYVVDQLNHRIRFILPDGTVRTLAGSGAVGNANGVGENAQFSFPEDIAIDNEGNLFVADRDNRLIRKIVLE